jgi:hypothetical protein
LIKATEIRLHPNNIKWEERFKQSQTWNPKL